MVNLTVQGVIVTLMVAAAVGWLCWHFYKKITANSRKKCSGGGCDKCQD